jgi:hypothetical protein
MSTDVMTYAASYPDEPLPGPNYAFVESPTLRGDVLYKRVYPQRFPELPTNPVLEPPMFFPGNAWKGTSGMPQHRYA